MLLQPGPWNFVPNDAAILDDALWWLDAGHTTLLRPDVQATFSLQRPLDCLNSHLGRPWLCAPVFDLGLHSQQLSMAEASCALSRKRKHLSERHWGNR